MIICVFPVCKRKTIKETAGFTVVFEPNLLLIGITSYLGVVAGWLLFVKVTKHKEFNDRECLVFDLAGVNIISVHLICIPCSYVVVLHAKLSN